MSFRAERPRQKRALQLPIFVYGTLRRGQANYFLLRGYTLKEIPASVTGMALYSLHKFPMIVEAEPESIVYGDLIVIHPGVYSRILADLDRLEGYDPATDSGLYRRIKRRIMLNPSAEAWAWLYLGNLETHSHLLPELIPDGDWAQFQRNRARRVLD